MSHYEANLKRDTYFPQNGCLHKYQPIKCREISYPLENIPTCRHPCQKVHHDQIYGHPVAAELYGDAVGMNEGTGLYYYHDTTQYSLSNLTVPAHAQPYHHADPHHG